MFYPQPFLQNIFKASKSHHNVKYLSVFSTTNVKTAIIDYNMEFAPALI